MSDAVSSGWVSFILIIVSLFTVPQATPTTLDNEVALATQAVLASPFGSQLLQNLEAGLLVNTDYSGYWSTEIALNDIKNNLPEQVDIMLWRASDISPEARHMLTSGSPLTRPMHVFGDITERVDGDILLRMRASFKDAMILLKRRLGECLASEVDAVSRKAGMALARRLHRILKQHATFTLKAMAWCFACQQQCYVHGPPWLSNSRVLRLTSAGTTCSAWSSFGRRGRCNDATMLPFLVWAVEQEALGVDLVVHVCIPGFPQSLLGLVFGAAYLIFSLVWSPVQLGHNVSRPRRWSVVARRDRIVQAVPQLLLSSLKELFMRRVVALSPSSVLRASPDQVRDFLGYLAARKDMPKTQPDGTAWDSEQVLMAGDLERLLGHRRWCRKRGLLPFGITNVNQTAKYLKGTSKFFPALLTRTSLLYDMVLRRLVTTEEKFEIMGLHVLDDGRDHSCGPGVEGLYFAGELSRKSVEYALGNAQVQHVVGIMMLWALSCIQRAA